MGTIETLGAMGTIWTMGTLGIVGTKGTMENEGKMKMSSRNLSNQQIWPFIVIIKFGSLMSSLTFGSLMPFDENVEKRIYNS